MTSQRVALVTGVSGDLGRSVSDRLVADGLSVAVIETVGNRRLVAAIFDQVEQDYGGVDVVVDIGGDVVVAQLAAARVRIGGAIVEVSTYPAVAMLLARELRDLDITVSLVFAGAAPTDVAEMVSFFSKSRIARTSAAHEPRRIVAQGSA